MPANSMTSGHVTSQPTTNGTPMRMKRFQAARRKP